MVRSHCTCWDRESPCDIHHGGACEHCGSDEDHDQEDCLQAKEEAEVEDYLFRKEIEEEYYEN